MTAERYVHQGVWVLTYNTESTVDGFVSLTGGSGSAVGMGRRGGGGRMAEEDTTRWRDVEYGGRTRRGREGAPLAGGGGGAGGGTGSHPLEVRSCRAAQYRGNITLLPSFIPRNPAERQKHQPSSSSLGRFHPPPRSSTHDPSTRSPHVRSPCPHPTLALPFSLVGEK